MRISSVGVGLWLSGITSLVGVLAACSGTAGSNGASGAAGEVGATGAQGTAGPAGPTGSEGATGAAGPAGATGAAGTTGATGAAAPTPDASALVAPNAVYVLSNDATANEIIAYARAADGSLSPFGSFPTGGTGSGAALGDEGALVFDAANNHFFAVNAGDNSISMLGLRSDGTIALLSKVAAGGVEPVSLTLAGDVLYVVNEGGGTAPMPANITGFTVDAAGLEPISSSTQALSASLPGPAQIQFVLGGTVLIVTEKGTNTIDAFPVTSGVAGPLVKTVSAGTTPYGFAASAGGEIVVSEANGGTATGGSTSSYSVAATGALTTVSASVASSQTAPCWVAVWNTTAYVANTGSATLTAYSVAANGALTLSNSSATTGAAPADIGITPDGAFLYTRNGGGHSLSVFSISASGALTKEPDFVGLPASAVGLVAR